MGTSKPENEGTDIDRAMLLRPMDMCVDGVSVNHLSTTPPGNDGDDRVDIRISYFMPVGVTQDAVVECRIEAPERPSIADTPRPRPTEPPLK